MAATAASAVPNAPPAAALPAPPHPAPEKRPSYKNLLQEWAHKNNKQLPVYHPELEGQVHQPQFRSTVEVDGERFRSQHSHSRRRDAEQDAALVAYVDLAVKIIAVDDDEDAAADDDDDLLGLIEQDVIFCKSILSDFAAKTKATQPTYSLDCVEGLEHMSLFISSVSFAGNIYTGEAARKKKDAEQRAARSAVLSILATKNPCMQQILRSKKQQIIAITSAGINKERVLSQENCNAPANAIIALAPITFVSAVGAVGATVDHVVNNISAAGPSAQAVSGSNKRKKHLTAELDVNHRNVRSA